MAAAQPTADLHKLQLALVADFLSAHGLSGTLEKLAGEVSTGTLVLERDALIKSLRMAKLATKSDSKSVLELLVSYFFKPADLESVPTEPAAPAAPPAEPVVPAAAPPAPEVTPAPVPAPVPAPEVVPAPVSAPSPAPAPVVPPAATAAPALPSQPAAAPAPAGGGFWARLQAQKAAAEGASEAPAAEAVPEAAAEPPAEEAAPAAAAAGGKGGFWARLQAQKAAGAGDAAPEAQAAAVTYKFTAPDGKGFNDKHAYRRHMFATVYSFSNKTGETLVKLPGQVQGQQFGMSDLKGCTALLCDHSDTVLVDRCQDCTIFIAASSNSVFLRNCSNCTITTACKQLRTRDLVGCKVFLYSKTDPVIEATSGLLLGDFNASCPGLTAAFAAANLQPENNHWRRVFDFHKGDGSYPMPHWTFLPEEQWQPWVIDLSEHGVSGTPENPVQRGSDADPATVVEAGGVSQVAPTTGGGEMATFDITTTSAADAVKALQA